MNLELDGKVALVTGGSRGIGRAIAGRLAHEGCDVMLVARGAKDLAHAARDIAAAAGRKVAWSAADVSTGEGIAATRAAIADVFGRLDVLVNNASGGGRHAPFLELSDEDWERGFSVKVFGTVAMCRACWPLLKASRGAVVNIGGNFAKTPSPHFIVGGAVGAAMTNFSKALAELGLADDVNVNVVQPGGTMTAQLSKLLESQARAQGISVDEVKRRNAAVTGIRRYAEPEDVARLVAVLASPRARHVHGTVAVVDGGATKEL